MAFNKLNKFLLKKPAVPGIPAQPPIIQPQSPLNKQNLQPQANLNYPAPNFSSILNQPKQFSAQPKMFGSNAPKKLSNKQEKFLHSRK